MLLVGRVGLEFCVEKGVVRDPRDRFCPWYK